MGPFRDIHLEATRQEQQHQVIFISHCSLLGFIASLLCQEGKQGIKSKAWAIKCWKEIKIAAPPNEWRNIPFIVISSFKSFTKLVRIQIKMTTKLFTEFMDL